MQRLFLLLFLMSPFFMVGQTNKEVTTTHQAAVNLLLKQKPSAKVIDIEKLTASQKDLDKSSTCSTCAKKAQKNKASQQQYTRRDLPSLKNEEIRLTQIITDMSEAQDVDKVTLAKYLKSLVTVKKEIEAYTIAQKRQTKSK